MKQNGLFRNVYRNNLSCSIPVLGFNIFLSPKKCSDYGIMDRNVRMFLNLTSYHLLMSFKVDLFFYFFRWVHSE